MNRRIAIILVIMLAVLGGGALLVRQGDRAKPPSNAAVLGQTVLKSLRAADIASIAVIAPAGTLTLEKNDSRWSIRERGGFPANFEKVRDFVLKMIELKVGQSESIGEADRARLELLEPGGEKKEGMGTLVEFRGADGKPLAKLIVGKKYFKNAPDDPAKAAGDGRFVLVPDAAGTVYIVGDGLRQASPKSSDWVSTAGIAPEKVKTLELKRASGEAWRVGRDGDHNGWKLDGIGAGEKLDFTRPNSASYTLGRLALADVASPDVTDAAAGLDKPDVVTATTLDGLTYVVRLGREEGANRYARLEAGGAALTARVPEKGETAEDKARRDKDFEERLKKIAERFDTEKSLSKYIVLVPKSGLEDILKKRSELLEPKGR